MCCHVVQAPFTANINMVNNLVYTIICSLSGSQTTAASVTIGTSISTTPILMNLYPPAQLATQAQVTVLQNSITSLQTTVGAHTAQLAAAQNNISSLTAQLTAMQSKVKMWESNSVVNQNYCSNVTTNYPLFSEKQKYEWLKRVVKISKECGIGTWAISIFKWRIICWIVKQPIACDCVHAAVGDYEPDQSGKLGYVRRRK